ISIIGVTIGTAVLIIVLSVFNGFFEVIKCLLLSHDPDIRIESIESSGLLYDRDLRDKLQSIPQIKVVSPYIAGKALLAADKNNNRVLHVKGIEPDSFTELTQLKENITEGKLDLTVRDHRPGLVLNNRLRGQMGIIEGQTVALLSAEGMQHALTQFSVPRTERMHVAGFYDITQIIDVPPAYISL